MPSASTNASSSVPHPVCECKCECENERNWRRRSIHWIRFVWTKLLALEVDQKRRYVSFNRAYSGHTNLYKLYEFCCIFLRSLFQRHRGSSLPQRQALGKGRWWLGPRCNSFCYWKVGYCNASSLFVRMVSTLVKFLVFARKVRDPIFSAIIYRASLSYTSSWSTCTYNQVLGRIVLVR